VPFFYNVLLLFKELSIFLILVSGDFETVGFVSLTTEAAEAFLLERVLGGYFFNGEGGRGFAFELLLEFLALLGFILLEYNYIIIDLLLFEYTSIFIIFKLNNN